MPGGQLGIEDDGYEYTELVKCGGGGDTVMCVLGEVQFYFSVFEMLLMQVSMAT